MREPATLPGLDIPPAARRRRRVQCPATPRGRAKKGGRIEREIVALHVEIGVAARRVPFSGSLASRCGPDLAGDVKVWAFGADAPPLTAEVKARAAGAGFATLERWLGGFDVLVLKRNNAPPLVTLPWRTWAMLLTRGRA